MYVLGIDGGGTKTTGVIANIKGEKVAEATVGGSNLNSLGRDIVEGELTKLINTLRAENNESFLRVTRVFAGMAGGGNKSNKADVQNILTSLLAPSVDVTVNHDAITALYSGTMGRPGIVQIAGTGAITYGINQKGDQGRVGGWGHLFSDHGSGYAIGRDGLSAAFMFHDRLAEYTYLHDLILQYFEAKELPCVVGAIYQGGNPKGVIASLSKLVVEAADYGDQIAKDIINENGIQLGKAISTLIKKLFPVELATEAIPVVLAGGLFNRYELFKVSIERTVKDNDSHIEVIIPQILPVGGAVIAALLEEKIEINKMFTDAFCRHEK
ncbi:N-acetylglucosamine kinase [Sporosarcina sp. FSL K6-1508]|uniref:N-acetylglucosamine kinase n=1 Tax=Sporosarcina sp. FSL K6-1508 TaxID=2921553 RepID=UPI0030F906C7